MEGKVVTEGLAAAEVKLGDSDVAVRLSIEVGTGVSDSASAGGTVVYAGRVVVESLACQFSPVDDRTEGDEETEDLCGCKA